MHTPPRRFLSQATGDPKYSAAADKVYDVMKVATLRVFVKFNWLYEYFTLYIIYCTGYIVHNTYPYIACMPVPSPASVAAA